MRLRSTQYHYRSGDLHRELLAKPGRWCVTDPLAKPGRWCLTDPLAYPGRGWGLTDSLLNPGWWLADGLTRLVQLTRPPRPRLARSPPIPAGQATPPGGGEITTPNTGLGRAGQPIVIATLFLFGVLLLIASRPVSRRTP